jgi:hypothetical protein
MDQEPVAAGPRGAAHRLRKHHLLRTQERNGGSGAHQAGLAHRIHHGQGARPLGFPRGPGDRRNLVTWGLTAAIFGQAPGSALWSASLAWLAYGVLFIAVMTLLSVLIGSSAGAAGVGIGAYALFAIAATWEPLGTYSPAALTTVPYSLLAGKDVAVLWPVLTSLLLAAALFALAARAFRRSEL